MATTLLFRDDPYLAETDARVVAAGPDGIVLDRTVFYATGGGQPGDCGLILRASGEAIAVSEAVYGADRSEIVHRAAAGAVGPEAGETVTARLDWPRRHLHMRVHTGLHLLSVALPYPVTGGRIGAGEGHLDFDIAGPVPPREEIEANLAGMVAADHPVSTEWITDEELLANPGLVKTMAVKPPMGTGRVRLVRIGDIDLQPCGGTHVRATGEIGRLAVVKIENKGKQNRRVRIRLADAVEEQTR